MPHAGGRPPDLTPEVIEDINRVLPVVLYLETTADYLGIDRVTFHRWLKRAGREAKRIRKGHKPNPSEALYAELRHTVKKAIASGAFRSLKIIGDAAEKQWQAAAWLQERRYPKQWALRDRREIMELTEQVKILQKKVDAFTQASHAQA